MKLWLIRHSTAVDAEIFDGPDLARPLTAGGRKKANRFFRTLAKNNARPDRVICSQAARARETAELFAKAFKLRAAKEDPRLNPGCPARDVVCAVHRHLGKADFLVLIGHEPGFSTAASKLAAGGRLHLVLRKCGLIEMEVSSPKKAAMTALIVPD